MNKIKILVVSNTAWSTENSFGITFSSFFEGMSDVEIANIYCNYGAPKNNCVKKYYQITEKSLIANLKNKKSESGISFVANQNATEHNDLNFAASVAHNSNFQKKIRRSRLQIAMWARDIVWKIGRWKSPKLEKFVLDFAPDIIFAPVYYKFHTNRILRHVQKLTNAPMMCYISDDIYLMNQFSLSPFYWIDRLFKRCSIRKTLKECSTIYVVCDKQKVEYEKIFGVECKVMLRPADISAFTETDGYCETRKSVRFVYAGNLGAERWKTLSMIGKAVDSVGGVLQIYSATDLSSKMKKAFGVSKNNLSSKKCNKKEKIQNGIQFMGSVAACDAASARRNADILVYAEGFSKKAFGKTRFSISTKLPDYLGSGKTVLAAGPNGIASIDYLVENNCAVVADSEDKIVECVELCVKMSKNGNNHNIYVENAQKCMKYDFNRELTQIKLKTDVKCAVNAQNVEKSENIGNGGAKK